MSLNNKLTMLRRAAMHLVCYPRESIHALINAPYAKRAGDFVAQCRARAELESEAKHKDTCRDASRSTLEVYFDNLKDGPGIWKWRHYFDIYETHLRKFVGKKATIVEIGIYSGGSLGMWRHYFGEECHIHGIDIQPACRKYANDYTTIHIGDQASRDFWNSFRKQVPRVDVVIDDGGHLPEQQLITLEEMLPHVTPGGVFLCEDVLDVNNAFAAYTHRLCDSLNAFVADGGPSVLGSPATDWQSAIESIHYYPFATVLVKRKSPIKRFEAPKHGSQWQPFFNDVDIDR